MPACGPFLDVTSMRNSIPVELYDRLHCSTPLGSPPSLPEHHR